MFKNFLLIAKEEYITRVTKKSFILITLLAPFLFSGFYAAIIYIATSDLQNEEVKQFAVYDPDKMLDGQMDSTTHYNFEFVEDQSAREKLNTGDYYGFVSLHSLENGERDSMELITSNFPSIVEKQSLKKLFESRISEVNFKEYGITSELIDSMNRRLNLRSNVLNEDEIKSSASELRTGVGYALSLIIYLFIFIYGVQVMKGVNEEKTNRIVEIVISTVKPFELMLGKVVGVAMVGLTQFLTWIIMTALLSSAAVFILWQGGSVESAEVAGGGSSMEILNGLSSLPFGSIIASFIFYFLGGYMVYASLFAAVAAAVDSDTDYQQFIWPISLPLIFAFVIAQMVVIKNPDSALAVWTSIIPITSPIVMMVRMTFGVPWIQLLASALSLIAFFFFTIWAAGKIYRMGILLYGKKIGYKDLIKWLFKR
jgi:ABC-2 type transport system permease protein